MGSDSRILLPLPGYFDDSDDYLPENIAQAINALAVHRVSELSEFAKMVPEEIFDFSHEAVPVSVVKYREHVYDKYFLVGRSAKNARLYLALALLRTVRDIGMNAAQGHNLEPAVVADLLGAIRTSAEILSHGG